jgi:tetrahydromethanopterin S-methyltransferase subunit H
MEGDIMFVFKTKQQVIDFKGISIGGPAGENPTVLVGGLFFAGQEVTLDTKTGKFEKDLTSKWIGTALDVAERTGHPLVLQVYGRTPEAMESHIPWTVENFDGPFMFESINARARIRAIELCEEMGLTNSAIYNGVNISLKDDEKEALSTSKLEMAVALGWSPKTTSLPDRMGVIQQVLDLSSELGFSKLLVDPATMPVGAGYGLDYRTLVAIKSEFGLPTCLGPHNAPSAWKFLKEPGYDDEPNNLAAIVASTTAAQLFAADCIMFGSLKRSKEVFTAVSLIANAISAGLSESYRSLGMKQDLFDPPTFE